MLTKALGWGCGYLHLQLKDHNDAAFHLHDLLQSFIASSEFGHGECGGDADGGHEDVRLGAPAKSQLFVQWQTKASIGLWQFPYSGIGEVRDCLRLQRWSLRELRAAIDTVWLQREVLGFGRADVYSDGNREEWQEHQNQQAIGKPHPGKRTSKKWAYNIAAQSIWLQFSKFLLEVCQFQAQDLFITTYNWVHFSQVRMKSTVGNSLERV